MSVWVKIPIFLGFLIATVIWIFVSHKLTAKLRAGEEAPGFWHTLLITAFSIVTFFSFLFILSGYLNIKLLLLFFLLSITGMVVYRILLSLFGSTEVDHLSTSIFIGAELGAKHPILLIGGMIVLPTLTALLYVIMVGITYFGNEVPSQEVTIAIFRYTVIYFFGVGELIQIPTKAAILSSRYLNEATRQSTLYANSAGLITTALTIAIAAWAFGVPLAGQSIDIGSMTLSFSPFLVIVLLLYFFCVLILPYFIGTHQGKLWRIKQLNAQNEAIGKAVDILEFPAPEDHHQNLSTLSNQFSDERKDIIAGDLFIEMITELDQQPATTISDPTQKQILRAYHAISNVQPRFQYIEFLKDLIDKIEAVIPKLDALQTDHDKIERAHGFANALKSEQVELGKQIEKEEKSKPIAGTAILFVVSAIFAALLSNLGNWIWKTFLSTT